MIVENEWVYVYKDGYNGWTGHDLDNINGYYPIGILGYEINKDNFVMRSIKINDAWAAQPTRSASIEMKLEKTQNISTDEDTYVTVYILFVKSVYLYNNHPGYDFP